MTIPVPPNTTGWTTIRDPNPGANWTPPMNPLTDYILLPAVGQTQPRDHQIIIQHGRNILMYGMHLTRGDTDGGPCIMLDGGDNPSTMFMQGCLLDDSGGKETDGLRSRFSVIPPSTGSGLRNLSMLDCRVVDNRGQTNPRPGKNGNTVINAAMNASQTTIVVADLSQITPPCTVIVDNEVMTFTGTSGANTLTGAVRGVQGTAAASHANGAALQMTNDFGGPTSGTHADCIQLAGGLGNFNTGYCTFHSRYSCLQLQQEQQESGTYKTITAITRVGSTVTVTTSASHLLNVGDYVQIGNGVAGGGQDCSPSAWNGTYRVDSVPGAAQLQYDLGSARTPSAITNLAAGPTLKKSDLQYLVGNIDLDHVNLVMDENDQQFFSGAPSETTNALRIGGRPDYKGYEDQTPMTDTAWGGTLSLNQVYLHTFNLGAAGVMNPGSSGSTYPVVKGNLNAGIWTWPSWPKVNGQVTVGDPPGGDFCPSWRPGLRYPGSIRRRAL